MAGPHGSRWRPRADRGRPGDRRRLRRRGWRVARGDGHCVEPGHGSRQDGVSTSRGLYSVAGLRPGTYTVTVALAGFRSARRDGIRVETGATRRLDFRLDRRRRDRNRHRHRRRAGASRHRQPGPGRLPGKDSRAAAQRPQLHHAGVARARRRAAAGVAVPAHQRRPAAHQRVSVRRHLGAAARAGAGRVLPGRGRDSGIQDRDQQPAGRIRPLQRRRHQPDDQVGLERASRHRASSSSGTSR